MPTYTEMRGRCALVTGATAGIGKATTIALHKQGAAVYGLSIDDPEHPCDLRDPAGIERVITGFDKPIDYVVNNAGIDPIYTIDEGDSDCYTHVMDLNLRAYYLVIRQALPYLRRGSGKAIVNVSSINYRLGVPRRGIYSASKAGILGLTTGLARELAAENIRINTVTPGWVFTDRQIDENFTDSIHREKNLSTIKQRQALDRQIQPSDIAEHILFYLSEASSASTGHNCVVDGGWLLE